MKKTSFVLIAVFTWLLPLIAVSSEFEKISFDAPTKKEYTISMSGFFSKSGIANPNDTIFTFLGEHKEFSRDIYYFNQYKFIGRTGEKTFEIMAIEKGPGLRLKETREKINMYFDDTAPYSLKFMSMNTKCDQKDRVLLKMIKLSGNQLEFQLILPDCLTSK
ncbi:MAG: hypothetical protein HZC10_05080 [Nitrospirae bacterium]|nr:hypothetical protein [Nitrospirota bacterium]